MTKPDHRGKRPPRRRVRKKQEEVVTELAVDVD
jgi:hypothetical protein